MSSDFDDEREEDGATVIAAPSFDELMARREAQGGYDDGTAVEAPSYDAMLAQRAGLEDPMAYAQTAAGAPSYDERLQAAGLPLPEDEPAEPPATSVPKTMILQPQDWGSPGALPSPTSSPAAPAPPPSPYAPFGPTAPRPPMAQPMSAARPKSNVTLFLVAAGAGVLIFGTCAAGVIAALLLR